MCFCFGDWYNDSYMWIRFFFLFLFCFWSIWNQMQKFLRQKGEEKKMNYFHWGNFRLNRIHCRFIRQQRQSFGKMWGVRSQSGQIHMSKMRSKNVLCGLFENSQKRIDLWRYSRSHQIHSHQKYHRIRFDERLCISRELYQLYNGTKTGQNQTNHRLPSNVARAIE